MQKIINGIAIFSGAVALGVVGLGGYVFIERMQSSKMLKVRSWNQ